MVLLGRLVEAPASTMVPNSISSFFPRFTQFGCMVTYVLRGFLDEDEAESLTFWPLGLLYVFTSVFNIWTLLYFLELIGPRFGIYSISIQRMIGVLGQFLIIFFLLFFSFQFAFFRLYNDYGTCEYGYTSFIDSFYSTFIIMLNMVDIPDQLGVINVTYVALHVLYIFMVAILLLNYLIALMSDVNCIVMSRGPILLRLQQVSAALLVERRLCVLFKKWLRKRQEIFFKIYEDKYYLVCQV